MAPDAPWTTWTAPTPNVDVTDPETAALRVKLIELPSVPGGDVCDWLSAGHSAQDLTAIIEAAPYWTPHGAELERADRKRALTRERVRKHRARRDADRLRPSAVTLRRYESAVTRNAVTHPERTSFYITRSSPLKRAA